MKQPTATGTIESIHNEGTIIMVCLRTVAGFLTPVFFDHRPFRWLLDGENCSVAELLGRQASFDGEKLTFGD